MLLFVNIRRSSPWFGRYVVVTLGQITRYGFLQALHMDSKHLRITLPIPVTKEYSPQHECCIKWDDPDIGIPWPIREGVILSERDKRCPPLREAETNFTYP